MENAARAVRTVRGRRPPFRPGSPLWNRTLVLNFLYVLEKKPRPLMCNVGPISVARGAARGGRRRSHGRLDRGPPQGPTGGCMSNPRARDTDSAWMPGWQDSWSGPCLLHQSAAHGPLRSVPRQMRGCLRRPPTRPHRAVGAVGVGPSKSGVGCAPPVRQ